MLISIKIESYVSYSSHLSYFSYCQREAPTCQLFGVKKMR